jgi:hypothetical protein
VIAAGAAYRHALDEGVTADDRETHLVRPREHGRQARLAGSGRTHDGEGSAVRKHE